MPIAPPPSTPQALAMGGAALSAPSGSRRQNPVAPLPQQVLPPGLPPLPLSKAGILPQGSPYV